MTNALRKLDLRLALFFQIPDIELRIKLYKVTFITSLVVLELLYLSSNEVAKTVRWE